VTTGGGRAKKAIEELGLAQRITSGEIKTSEQFFDAIVVQFKNIDSAAVRAGLAAQLFGREAGAKMAETLSMGTEALAEMEAGVDGVISDENIKRADELDKAFRSMAQTVGSTLKNAFVSATYAVFDFFGAFKTEAEAADDLVKSIKQQLEAREFLSPARIAELQARLDEALEAQRQAGRNVRAQSSTRQGVRDRMAGGTGEVAPGLPDEISIAAQPFMPVAHTEFPGMGLEESLRATRASGSMDPFMLTPEMREQAMEEAAEQRAEMAAAIVKDHANLAQQVVDEERRLAAERIEVEQSVQDAKMAAAYSAIGFLQVLGREHRGAARAALAIEKALAIKQIIFNTRVAAAKALAQFGPLGKPAAIAILAWGAAQAAFVASQGWSEASQIPSSGSGSIPGTGSNPLITSPASSAAAGALSSQRQSAVQVIIQGDMYGWDEYIQRRVIDGIRRAVDGRDVVIIGPNSRNAEILRDAA
jgi:hypothetical protein